MKQILLLLILALITVSCASKKDILYFQDSSELNLEKIEKEFQPTIEVNDILYITLSSSNIEVLEPFLRVKQIQQTNSAYNKNPGLGGYLVNVNGEIRFPILGDIQVEGKTRQYIEEYLKNKIANYVTDVVVDVRIMNFKITVIGEVKRPGIFPINDERVTLMEAIALAGDLTVDANRKTITVIREENDVQKVAKINLTTSDIYNSEFYFLKQNDLVYVEPSKKGVVKTGFVSDISILLSIVTVLLSTVILVTNIK